MRLFMFLTYSLLDMLFFVAALATKDQQKRQTRILFAIWFALGAIAQVLNAVAIHTGAFPLWNNR